MADVLASDTRLDLDLEQGVTKRQRKKIATRKYRAKLKQWNGSLGKRMILGVAVRWRYLP